MNQDPLDALLKPRPYLDDAGFTQAVMGRLPPRKAPSGARGKILGIAALAAVIALVAGPARVLLGVGISEPMLAALALTCAVFAGTAVSITLREAERW